MPKFACSAAALAGVAAATLALCVTMLPGVLAVFLTLFSLAESKDKDFYTFKVVNSRGKLVSLEKYRGSVSLDVLVRVGDLCMSVGCMNECCMFILPSLHYSPCRRNNTLGLWSLAPSGWPSVSSC